MSAEDTPATGSVAVIPPVPPKTAVGYAGASAPFPAQPWFDPRYAAPILITLILLIAHFAYGALKSPLHTGVAIGSAILCEIVLGYLFYGKMPNLASAYVSGISVGILVRTEALWPFAFVSVLSIMSKYVLRVKGRHIWNPSNFGIAAALLVAHDSMATLGPEFDNKIVPFIIVAIIGSLIVGKLRRLHISAAYALSFVFFAWVRSLINGQPFFAEVAPITGPMYMLFTFFMITDPKTTVKGRNAQILVAFLVAGAECVLRLAQNIHAPYFALFTVGPIANLVEIWWVGRSAAEQKVATATA
jgi:Na+-transporting NADH:ubiquinone oxidoreductase subunit NqrB